MKENRLSYFSSELKPTNNPLPNTPKTYLKHIIKHAVIQNLIIPEIEVCAFPWYCFYRNTQFIYNESLKHFSKLLVQKPEKNDHFYKIRKIYNRVHIPYFVKELGIRCRTRWFSEQPTRTGREVILCAN